MMWFVAQALAERGLIDAFVAGFDRALLQLDTFVGHGNGKWVAGAVIVGITLLFLRRR